MRITRLELLPLDCRAKAQDGLGSDTLDLGSRELTPEQLALRRYAPPEIVLVRLETDTGLEGLGEGATLPHYFNLPLGGLIDWLKRLAPQVVGYEPRDLVGLHRRMEQVAGFGAPGCHPARAAIDMAVHDLLGKAAGCPVYELLGGAYRTSFELQTQMHGFTPEQQLAVARHYIDLGFRGLKVKLGGSLRRDGFSKAALDAEAAKLALVVAELPDDLIVDADANQAFGSAKLARLVVEQALRVRLHTGLALEQPLHHLDLSGHRHLREVLPIPVVLDESVVSPEAMLQIIKHEAADRIVLKINRVGGFWPARKIVHLCEAANIGISLDTMPFTLLGDTALCHLGATIRDPYPADAEGHTFFADTPFVGGIRLEGGRAVLPDSPGLGIAIDPDKLESLVMHDLVWSG